MPLVVKKVSEYWWKRGVALYCTICWNVLFENRGIIMCHLEGRPEQGSNTCVFVESQFIRSLHVKIQKFLGLCFATDKLPENLLIPHILITANSQEVRNKIRIVSVQVVMELFLLNLLCL